MKLSHKALRKLLPLFLIGMFMLGGLTGSYASDAVDETTTVIFYLIGSDIETYFGSVSEVIADLETVENDENLNIIFYATGAEYWHDEDIQPEKKLWKIENGEKTPIYKGYQSREMALVPEHFTNILTYAKSAAPADKYHLVVFGHGGGALFGLTGDMYNPDYVMQAPTIAESIENADIKFETITLNSCILGSFETAAALKDSADYLISSQENAFIINYSEVLNAKMNGELETSQDFGLKMLDEYERQIKEVNEVYSVSLIDLKAMESVVEKTDALFSTLNDVMTQEDLQDIVHSRIGVETYGQGIMNMVDMISFIDALQADGAKKAELTAEISNAIVDARHGLYSSGSNGMSIFAPYWGMDVLHFNFDFYSDMEISKEYNSFLGKFLAKLRKDRTPVNFEITQNEENPNTFEIKADDPSQLEKVFAHIGVKNEDDNIVYMTTKEVPLDGASATGIIEYTYDAKLPVLNGESVFALYDDTIANRLEYRIPVLVDDYYCEIIAIADATSENPVFKISHAEFDSGSAVFSLEDDQEIKPLGLILNNDLEYVDIDVPDNGFKTNLAWFGYQSDDSYEGDVVMWFTSYDYAQNFKDSEPFLIEHN